jgi:lipid-A-disaccharide synthase
MTRKRVMLIAGEPSGDLLAAELVAQLRSVLNERGCEAEFFGAGGAQMQKAGVELAFDMTAHAVVGLIEALRKLVSFRRLLHRLLELALERRPDVVVCVDFSGFNSRFAQALRRMAQKQAGWSPKIVQYVSPQVWASRQGRAYKMARAYDLLLAIFPFETAWYAERVPQFRVEFVGHPILDRHSGWRERIDARTVAPKEPARVLLLPGSRVGEIKRHLPVVVGAARRIAALHQSQFRMVLPNEDLLKDARAFLPTDLPVECRSQGLAEALLDTDVALASTGTVTMECAYFRVPTVAFYKTSWSTYQLGRRLIKVKYLAMPNILANEAVFPELIQQDATAENIAREALSLVSDQSRRAAIRKKLEAVTGGLGKPGASRRAAEAVASLVLKT